MKLNLFHFHFQAKDAVREEVLESYCWMYARFKIPPDYHGPCSSEDTQDYEGIMYNSYYQWVPLWLIL